MIDEKHLSWAKQALENYCLVKSSGRLKDIMRHRKDPKAKFKPGEQPDSSQDIPLPSPVDYAIKDYWMVTIQWSKLAGRKPYLRPLLDLVMHVYGSGANRAIESFMVAAPFSPIMVPLESCGSNAVKNAKFELHQFVQMIAEQKEKEAAKKEREKKKAA